MAVLFYARRTNMNSDQSQALMKELEKLYDNPRDTQGALDISIWMQYEEAKRTRIIRIIASIIAGLVINGGAVYLVALLAAQTQSSIDLSLAGWLSLSLFVSPLSLLLMLVNHFLVSQTLKDKELHRTIKQHNQAVRTAISTIQRHQKK